MNNSDLINNNSLDDLTQLHKQFNNNTPFKHIVIDGFFQEKFCESLLKEFPIFDKKLATNEDGLIGNKAVNENIKDISQSYFQLNQLVKSPEFINKIEIITGISNLKYDPHYFGGGTHNNLNGQDLDPHIDFTNHPKTGYYRRLNLIIYLNKEWQSQWGGNIELHKNPRLQPKDDEIISVEPLFNRAVIFETTNDSWHGFPKINLPKDKKDISRKSFALYYYTPTIDHKIKTHSTIYIERHLPERYKAGFTLTNQDIEEIKILLARRDQHLERLYGYITNLNEATSGLKYAIIRKLLKLIGKH